MTSSRGVDDYFPGIVACEFVDAERRVHAIIDKLPMVTLDELDADSVYPQPGAIRCAVLTRWRDASGRDLVRISIAHPDFMETTEGLAEFVVTSAQVSWIPSGHREPNSQGILISVDDE